jgi:hypothetical protein
MMITYWFGDIDAYGAAVRPPPRVAGEVPGDSSPTWLPRADFGPIAGRQKFDTQLRRATSR